MIKGKLENVVREDALDIGFKLGLNMNFLISSFAFFFFFFF